MVILLINPTRLVDLLVVFHVLLGSVVLVLSFDAYYDHYSNWSCRGFILDCYPEAALMFVLIGLLPCDFPIVTSFGGRGVAKH